MMTIVEKIELGENSQLKSTLVGYTENVHLINEINEQYDVSLGSFLATNRTKLENEVVFINTFFNDLAYVHEARTSTNNIDELNLTEITDINQL